ncbi:hypothetical protein P775_03585 [Puniceibacterium antarcticum]|uniref:DUF2147 domain-containing protein n=1 Tax=Puniceibacterium antarcticum TaxID=1206336 RepID=A0A2G8RKJ0_9RHOB|nr:hypothetical protein [Puniceibacterium antarcticum]PIL21598.1 hypothetical protein P775_03585 [Puniceibacterium antarcticum]
MIAIKTIMAVCFALSLSNAAADPLGDMDGHWTGSGWARETPDGPKETVRCRLDNHFDSGQLKLTVSGRCVVPGRKIRLSGEIEGKDGSDRISGHWFNPDGIGSAAISGIQRENLIAFTFRAWDPATGRNLAQNIEWRTSGTTLWLRSTDREDPEITMSDLEFSR